MAWTPSESDLGGLNEIVSFSHTITYTDDTVEPPVEYPVVIVPTENNPDTINIAGNTISGYYVDSFNSLIKYRTKLSEFITVSKFNQISQEKLDQMISYKASLERTKVYSYTAKAMDGNNVVASTTYTKTVNNDWTSGKNSLQYYVGLTA
jgi:hypothetical protein